MASRMYLPLSEELLSYAVAHGTPPDDVAVDLAARTRALGSVSRMQIGHDQAALLTLLVRILGVRYAVEVGTFTGYSALSIARGLPADGRLLCCDISEEWTSIGRPAWEAAGVADRIDLRIAPALETLSALPEHEHIDFAFIDADKPGYRSYYEALLPRVKRNGVICVDNTLWQGNVLDHSDTSENTTAVRSFNAAVALDDRVEAVMMTIGDGITMIRKR